MKQDIAKPESSMGDNPTDYGSADKPAAVIRHHHKHNLRNRFELRKTLGQGTYGKVKLAVEKLTGREVAIKSIRKTKVTSEQDLQRIRREIDIMTSLSHPHIIHIYEVFENKEKIIIIMEYASGGELYGYINERRRLNDSEARLFFRQIASAVDYCHQRGIVHRDLKLENIVLDTHHNVKIADFGLSNLYGSESLLATFCGSPLYASPEIVNGTPYRGPEVDCWSLGVLLYTLVYGAMPFDGSNFKRLRQQITDGEFYEPAKPSDASSLIRHLLTVDVAQRATINDISEHWWVNVGYNNPPTAHHPHSANTSPLKPCLKQKSNTQHEQTLSQRTEHAITVASQEVSVTDTFYEHHKHTAAVSYHEESVTSNEIDFVCNNRAQMELELRLTSAEVNYHDNDAQDADIDECSAKCEELLEDDEAVYLSDDVNEFESSNDAKQPTSADQNDKTKWQYSDNSNDKTIPNGPNTTPNAIFDSSKKPKRGILKNSSVQKPKKYTGSDSGCVLDDNLPQETLDKIKTITTDEHESLPSPYQMADIEAILDDLGIATETCSHHDNSSDHDNSSYHDGTDLNNTNNAPDDLITPPADGVSKLTSAGKYNAVKKPKSILKRNGKYSGSDFDPTKRYSLGSTCSNSSGEILEFPDPSEPKSILKRRRSKAQNDPTKRYSLGSQGSNSSGDILDFSYDDLEGDPLMITNIDTYEGQDNVPTALYNVEHSDFIHDDGVSERLSSHAVEIHEDSRIDCLSDMNKPRHSYSDSHLFDLTEARDIYAKALRICGCDPDRFPSK